MKLWKAMEGEMLEEDESDEPGEVAASLDRALSVSLMASEAACKWAGKQPAALEKGRQFEQQCSQERSSTGQQQRAAAAAAGDERA